MLFRSPDTDQLLEDGLYTYAYDDNGNRVGKTRKSDGVTTTYKYDAFDRLIYAGIDSDDPYPPTSALGSRVYYAYDWAGRLARRISGCKADLDRLGGMYQAADVCVVTRYAYDGLNLAAEYAEDGSPLVIYNHAPGSIDRPVSMQIEGAVFYFHYDERGSVTHITNGFGHIVQRYVYDSFGRIVLQQGALPNAFTYTGRHWDPVARLYHYRARAYDPDTGRFLQHDPVLNINSYAYVGNNPVNFKDPFGLYAYEDDFYVDTRTPAPSDSSSAEEENTAEEKSISKESKPGNTGKTVKSSRSDRNIEAVIRAPEKPPILQINFLSGVGASFRLGIKKIGIDSHLGLVEHHPIIHVDRDKCTFNEQAKHYAEFGASASAKVIKVAKIETSYKTEINLDHTYNGEWTTPNFEFQGDIEVGDLTFKDDDFNIEASLFVVAAGAEVKFNPRELYFFIKNLFISE